MKKLITFLLILFSMNIYSQDTLTTKQMERKTFVLDSLKDKYADKGIYHYFIMEGIHVKLAKDILKLEKENEELAKKPTRSQNNVIIIRQEGLSPRNPYYKIGPR